ncbi:MAG: DUF2334 domain-containing protein [Nanoarchaeota archaeon]|nr:DUF2334 domain-containing protein [Nanoarchaeota archaeon]
MKKPLKVTLITLFILVSLLIVIRANSVRQIDDVTPGIYCEKEYLEKADILWVIPNYNNTPISQNQEWCDYVVSLNKTLGMHGVQHYYPEFKDNLTQEYIEEGIKEFENCFNQTPTMFKPPKLEISYENKVLITNNEMEIKRYSNQIFHKVYHCSDTGTLPNWFHDLF